MKEPQGQSIGALTGPALYDAKRALRDRMLAVRDALDPDLRQRASLAIVARLRQLPSFVAARCVLLTLPFGSEWDTRPLFDAAKAAGKAIALPRVNRGTRMLELHAVRDMAEQTSAGYRGIPEPLTELPAVDVCAIDWVLVPGLAFDEGGRRLGYGGGYFDRLLPLVTAGTPRIAGAFDSQIVAQVPAGPSDLTVTGIITPTQMLAMRAA